MDILLDDAVDFHVRLRRNGVPGKFRIFRTLPHGFWSMGDMLPEAHLAQKVAIEWILDYIKPRRAAGQDSKRR
jgi:acetyl esterase/lipase